MLLSYQGGGELETCLDKPEFKINADICFVWGVYYHIYDPIPNFPILNKLSDIAPTIIIDFLESNTGKDYVESYGYNSPSSAVKNASFRLTMGTITNALCYEFGNVYVPREQLNWFDPAAPHTPRRIIIGSKIPLKSHGLVESSCE